MTLAGEQLVPDIQLSQQRVEKDYPWNFWIIIVVEILWGAGLPFAMFSTVVPAYMESLRWSKTLIGVVASLFTILTPLQILLSHWYAQRSRKKCCAVLWIASLAPWAVYSVIAYFWPGLLGGRGQVLFFFMAMLTFAGLISASNALFFGLLTDCTPTKKRGGFYGYRLCGLAVALIALLPVTLGLMKKVAHPGNYHLAFLIGIFFYILSSLALLPIREHYNPQVTAKAQRSGRELGLAAQFRIFLRKLLRDPNFRVFIFFETLFMIAISFSAYIIVFAKERLHLADSDIPYFSVTQFICGAILTVILGKIADKFGYKIVGVLMSLILAVGFILITKEALSEQPQRYVIFLAFLCYAAVVNAGEMVKVYLTVELHPKQDSAMLVAMANTIITPVILVTSPLSGLIIDLTHSYVVVFALAACLSLIAAAGFVFLVHEPRLRKLYLIKQLRRL